MSGKKDDIIPEKITVKGADGKDIELVVKDTPELQSMLETARKQERSKLNSDITEYKAQINDLNNKVSKSAEDQKQLDELKGKLAVAESEKTKVQEQLDELKEMQDGGKGKGEGGKGEGSEFSMKALQKMLEENNKAILAQVEEKVGAVNKGLQGMSAAQYRESLLKEHEGKIIPELLNGSSKEELDASLVTALETSKKYLKADAGAAGGGDGGDGGKGAGDDGKGGKGDGGKGEGGDGKGDNGKKGPADPGKKGTPDPNDNILDRVKDMSPEEYEKNRAEILAATKKLQLENQD